MVNSTSRSDLDDKALKSPEVKAAFEQLRKIADWMDPNVASQHFSTNFKRFVERSSRRLEGSRP